MQSIAKYFFSLPNTDKFNLLLILHQLWALSNCTFQLFNITCCLLNTWCFTGNPQKGWWRMLNQDAQGAIGIVLILIWSPPPVWSLFHDLRCSCEMLMWSLSLFTLSLSLRSFFSPFFLLAIDMISSGEIITIPILSSTSPCFKLSSFD